MIVAFLTDGFMYDARTMSYFVSGCAPGGCETDSVFFAGVPRLPDLKDFVLEAGSIVLSLVTVASQLLPLCCAGFSFGTRRSSCCGLCASRMRTAKQPP